MVADEVMVLVACVCNIICIFVKMASCNHVGLLEKPNDTFP